MNAGMTPEEKNAVMQFMGETYGQAHKQDKMLVGSSGNLQPSSQQLKQVFEQTAKLPTQHVPQQHVPQQHVPQQQPAVEPAPPQPVVAVSPEQAAQEIAEQAAAVQVITQAPQDTNQLEFDLAEPSKLDKLISLTEKQNLLLKDISLKLDNGKDTKAKKQR